MISRNGRKPKKTVNEPQICFEEIVLLALIAAISLWTIGFLIKLALANI